MKTQITNSNISFSKEDLEDEAWNFGTKFQDTAKNMKFQTFKQDSTQTPISSTVKDSRWL
jgi:hypothetical protein